MSATLVSTLWLVTILAVAVPAVVAAFTTPISTTKTTVLPAWGWGRACRGCANTNPTTKLSAGTPGVYDYALLFDCDGVILETEELHRQAYNTAFQAFGLNINGEPVYWSVEYYDMLQNTVGGGKPKMYWHFRNTMGGQFPSSKIPNSNDDKSFNEPAAPPTTPEDQEALIDALQTFKTKQYKFLLEQTAVPRPGVLRLMDQALSHPRIAVGVCSASTKEAAQKTLQLTLGQDRVNQLNVCILGNDVSAKKPDPLIYNVARDRLNLANEAAAKGDGSSDNNDDDNSNIIQAHQCVVIEDSLIGLQAAKGAGMQCVITYTAGTASVDFYAHGAQAKVADLSNVYLEDIFGPDGPLPDLLVGKKEAQTPSKVASTATSNTES